MKLVCGSSVWFGKKFTAEFMMMFQMIGVAWYLDFESSGITIVSWLYRLKLKIVSELFNRMEHMVLFVCFT